MTTKVFVGNLAFQATDQDLTEAFTQCGKVKSGVIITRGRRSLGYGFVDFYEPQDASRAVDTMNQTEFRNRVIKVELVRDAPPPRAPRQYSTTNPNTTSSSVPTGGAGTTSSTSVPATGGDDNQDSGGGGAAPRRSRPTRPRRRPRRRLNDKEGGSAEGGNQDTTGGGGGGGGGGAHVPSASTADDGGGRPKGSAPRRPPRGRINNNNNNKLASPSAGGGTAGDGTSGRGPHNNNNDTAEQSTGVPQREKILSKTAVFVANLPFSVDDESLTKLFATHKVKTAHVVKTRTGRSRGYGFVDFETEKDQQAAIESQNNAQVLGANGVHRNISVTVSHSVAPQTEEKE